MGAGVCLGVNQLTNEVVLIDCSSAPSWSIFQPSVGGNFSIQLMSSNLSLFMMASQLGSAYTPAIMQNRALASAAAQWTIMGSFRTSAYVIRSQARCTDSSSIACRECWNQPLGLTVMNQDTTIGNYLMLYPTCGANMWRLI